MTSLICTNCESYKLHQVVRASTVRWGDEYMDCIKGIEVVIDNKCRDFKPQDVNLKE